MARARVGHSWVACSSSDLNGRGSTHHSRAYFAISNNTPAWNTRTGSPQGNNATPWVVNLGWVNLAYDCG